MTYYVYNFILICTCCLSPSQLAFMSRLKNPYMYMATTDVIILPEDYEIDDMRMSSTTDNMPESYVDDNTQRDSFWGQTYFEKADNEMEFEKPLYTRKENIDRFRYITKSDKDRKLTTTTYNRHSVHKEIVTTEQYFNEDWPAIPPHFAQTRSTTEFLTAPSTISGPPTSNMKTWRSYFPTKATKTIELFVPNTEKFHTTQEPELNFTWKFDSTEAPDYETPYSAEVADYERSYSTEIAGDKRPYSIDAVDYKNILYPHEPYHINLLPSKNSEKTRVATQEIPPDPALILRAKPPSSFYSPNNKTNRCYRCGLDTEDLSTSTCYKVFDQPNMIDRHKMRHYKTLCSGNTFIGGCYKRYLDIGYDYNERGCRQVPPEGGLSFASNRFIKLEYLLIGITEGCTVSPVAALVPLSRPISLYARFHVCVCVSRLCNNACKLSGTFLNCLFYIGFIYLRNKCL